MLQLRWKAANLPDGNGGFYKGGNKYAHFVSEGPATLLACFFFCGGAHCALGRSDWRNSSRPSDILAACPPPGHVSAHSYFVACAIYRCCARQPGRAKMSDVSFIPRKHRHRHCISISVFKSFLYLSLRSLSDPFPTVTPSAASLIKCHGFRFSPLF